MLAVVQHQQRAALPEDAGEPRLSGAVGGLPRPDRPHRPDRGQRGARHQRRVGQGRQGRQGRQVDQPHAVGVRRAIRPAGAGEQAARRLEREAGLAHAPGAGQRHQGARGEQAPDLLQLWLAPQEAAELAGQVVGDGGRGHRGHRPAGGPAAAHGRRREGGARLRGQPQGLHQARHGLPLGRAPDPPLEGADPLRAQPRPLGQGLLGQPGGLAVAPRAARRTWGPRPRPRPRPSPVLSVDPPRARPHGPGRRPRIAPPPAGRHTGRRTRTPALVRVRCAVVGGSGPRRLADYALDGSSEPGPPRPRPPRSIRIAPPRGARVCPLPRRRQGGRRRRRRTRSSLGGGDPRRAVARRGGAPAGPAWERR